MNDASDHGRAAAAAEIKKALRAPTGQLCKSNPPVALGQFRKSMRAVRRLRGMSLAKRADMLERAARVAAAAEAIKAAPIDASVDAVRKVHATGPQLETGDTMWLYKT